MQSEQHPVIEMVEKTLEGLIQKGAFSAFYELHQSINESIFTDQEAKKLRAFADDLIKTARKDKLMEGLLRVLHGDDTASVAKAVRDARSVGQIAVQGQVHSGPSINDILRQKERYESQKYLNANRYGGIDDYKKLFGDFE